MTAADTRRPHLVAEVANLMSIGASAEDIAEHLFTAGWCGRPDGPYEPRPDDEHEVRPGLHSRTSLPVAFLVSAFRYSLGRRSYMPSWVAEELIAHLDVLEPLDRQQIVRDIDTAIAADAAGAACDVDTWRHVRTLFDERERADATAAGLRALGNGSDG